VDSHNGPADPFQVSFPGPFQHHEVVVQGWSVPFLKASLRGEDGVRLLLDDRLGVELSTEESERLIPFIADAIAVALGYGAHPREQDSVPLERAPYPRPQRVVTVDVPERAA
jgi:hypothetical protein